jgi:hypothetical protein
VEVAWVLRVPFSGPPPSPTGGLAAELTGFVADCGCNVEDSRIVVLGGYADHASSPGSLPSSRRSPMASGDLSQTGIWHNRVARVDHRGPATPRVVVRATALDHEGIIHAR